MENLSPSQDAVRLLQQNRLLTEEIQRRVRQLAAINTVAATVSQSLDLDVTLNTALDAVLSVIQVDAAGISLVDEAARQLVLRAQRGWKHDFVSKPMSIPLGQGLSGLAIAEDRLVVTGDVRDDQRLAVPSFNKEEIKAQALAPMHARGRVIGVLSLMSRSEYAFSAEELDVLKAIADQVGVALDNAQLYETTCHQESRLSAIIQSAADAILVFDGDGQLSLLNPAAVSLLHLRPERALGKPLDRLNLPAELLTPLTRAIQHATTPTFCDVELVTGEALTAVVSRLRLAPEDGAAESGWVMVLRDVSHLKQAENTRMEFVQTAAHDLRNPLGVTMSALVMLKDFLPSDPAPDEIYEIAVDAVHRMQALLDDLLDLEHIQSKVGFETQRVDLRDLLGNVARDMSPLFVAEKQTLTLDLPDDLPEVTLSPQWFERAVGNYLSNANKYTPSGGTIILRARVKKDELVVEVEDDGIGIPVEMQVHLFERFYRMPTSKPKKGSGLGLAMVKSVMEAHGGRVYVFSKPGEGSVFGMALPR